MADWIVHTTMMYPLCFERSQNARQFRIVVKIQFLQVGPFKPKAFWNGPGQRIIIQLQILQGASFW
jgi:hypothetical protein